jgi:hypothetical protein
MSKDIKPKGYWTKERCQEEALKYKTKTKFAKNSGSAYSVTLKNKWLIEICSHMTKEIKPIKWTKETCLIFALECETRSQFSKKYVSAYEKARLNNWLDEICSHMKICGSLYKRLIYLYEFSDKSVYVGLTYNYESRHKNHMMRIKSPVYKHIKETGLIPIHTKLTEYIDVELAKEKEIDFINFYKKSGYNILNKRKGGELGTPKQYNYNNCKKEAFKYNTRNEFRKNCRGIYKFSQKNNWIDEICSHMKILRIPCNYWTKDKCYNEAIKYKTRHEFQLNNRSAYNNTLKNKWLDEWFTNVPDYKWSKEKCYEEAKKYKTKNEFCKNSPSAYNISRRKGWLNEIYLHMIEIMKPIGYWTKEKCYDEAIKFKNSSEFKKNSSSAYNFSYKNKWLHEFYKNTKEYYWSLDKCLKIALKYTTKKDWILNDSKSYKSAVYNKWVNDCTIHMIEIHHRKGYWTKEKCQEESLKYITIKDFCKNSVCAYTKSRKNNWIDEFFPKIK